MAKWGRALSENIAANLMAAGVIAAGTSAWAYIRNFAADEIGFVAVATFALALLATNLLAWWQHRRHPSSATMTSRQAPAIIETRPHSAIMVSGASIVAPISTVAYPAAIAYPFLPTMLYENDEVLVWCSVAFYALTDVKESPTELEIRVDNDGTRAVVGRVRLPGAPRSVPAGTWTMVIYSGSVDSSKMEIFKRATRQVMQPPRGVKGIVTVEFIVPGGAAAALHESSGVCFGNPQTDRQRFAIEIGNFERSTLARNHFDRAIGLLEDGMSMLHNAVSPRENQAIAQRFDAWMQSVRSFFERAREDRL
jgi:hypothetical protein